MLALGRFFMRVFSQALDLKLFHQNIVAFANANMLSSNTGFIVCTSLEKRLTYILAQSSNTTPWSLLYTWECSIGKPSTPTPTGLFSIIGHRPNFGSSTYQVKYATRFKPGYYYHSILFDGYGNKTIDTRLGVSISNGCIRLLTANAKWLYDNIPLNTPVIIN